MRTLLDLRLPHASFRHAAGTLAALALSTLAPGAAAQIQLGEPSLASLPPLGNSQAEFQAAAAGDIDSDQNAELAVILGEELVIFPSPAVMDDSVVVLDEVTDVCYWMGYGGTSKPGFLVTSERGLELVQQLVPGSYSVTLLSNEAKWVDAKVRAGVETTGGLKVGVLVGLATDGQDVFHATLSTGGLTAATTFFTSVATVLDLQLLDWDGDAQDIQEVALLRTTGLQIRPRILGANPLLGRAVPVSDDSIVVLRKKSSPRDVLAWTLHAPAPAPAAPQHLLLLCPEFVSVAGSPALGPYPLPEAYAALAAGDLQGEEKDALILVPAETATLNVLENQSVVGSWLSQAGNTPFLVEEAVEVPLHAASEPRGVLCEDFFAQRDATGRTVETLAALHPTEGVAGIYPVVEAWQKVDLISDPQEYFHSAFYESARYLSDPDCLSACSATGNWRVDLIDQWGSTPGANAVEMVVRVSFNNFNLHNTAYHHEFFTIESEIDGMSVDFDTSSPTYFTFNDCGENTEPLQPSFFVMVRPVIQSNGNVSQAWPWAILGVTADCPGHGWLRTRQGAASCGPLVSGNACMEPNTCEPTLPTCFQAGGASYIPVPVPQSKLPSAGHILPVIHPAPY